MSSSPSGSLSLYDTETLKRIGSATVDGQDVIFPEEVRGWSDVLDCRPEPYNTKSVEDNCHFASHVHKQYILVSES